MYAHVRSCVNVAMYANVNYHALGTFQVASISMQVWYIASHDIAIRKHYMQSNRLSDFFTVATYI